MLAELCPTCALRADPLLALYGGRGRDSIRLVAENRAAPQPQTLSLHIVAYGARGILYVLIALASFVLVTLVTSRGR